MEELDEYNFWTEGRWTVLEIILFLRTLIGILPQLRNCDRVHSFLSWGTLKEILLSWGTVREIIPELRNRERVPSSAEEFQRSFLCYGTVIEILSELRNCERDNSSAEELRKRLFMNWKLRERENSSLQFRYFYREIFWFGIFWEKNPSTEEL